MNGEAEAGKPTVGRVYDALRTVEDPEIRQNIVGLGLIYGVDISEGCDRIEVRMTLTTPYCPYAPDLVEKARRSLLALPGVKEAVVRLVWEPPWDPKTMASDEVKDALGLW